MIFFPPLRCRPPEGQRVSTSQIRNQTLDISHLVTPPGSHHLGFVVLTHRSSPPGHIANGYTLCAKGRLVCAHTRGRLPLCAQPTTVCCLPAPSELDVKFAVVTEDLLLSREKGYRGRFWIFGFEMTGRIQIIPRTAVLKSTKSLSEFPSLTLQYV